MRTTFTGLLLHMFLYFTVVSAIPAPDNVTILSDNFKHILKWSPGKNSSPQTVFNIRQRCSYGKPIVMLNISNTTVDVSKSLEDIYKSCTFLIWASLDNMTSSKVRKSITPYEDTVLGPPIVVLSGCGDCLKINISLPRGSGENKKLDRFYNAVSFNISWKKAEEKKVNHVPSDGDYVLKNLKPGEKYCIRVVPIIISNRNTQSSDWQCEYTSREAQRQVLYLVGWSLGAVLFGLGVLVPAGILFYIGCLFKLKTLLPKALSNIVQTYYMNPEQTMTESLLLTDAQLKNLRCDPTKNSPLLNLDHGPHKEQHEDDDNVGQKADTEDDEDYNKEDEEDNCTYMDRIINHSSLKTTEIGENCIVSSLPLLYSSSICYTENKIAMHPSVTTLSQHIQSDENEYEEEVMTEVSRENQKLPKFRFEPEGNADGSDATGDINLLSVTLRSFGPEEDGKDWDKKEQCKLQEELYTIPPSVQTEEKTEDPITKGSQRHFSLCSYDSDIETNQDLISGYTATDTGGIHKQNSCTTEETDYCDTGYITR